MWHSKCDDLCSPVFPALPMFPQCCCFQVLRVLDPPCTYSPTLNITLPAGFFICLSPGPTGAWKRLQWALS